MIYILGRHGEALLTFFECLVFEENLTKPLRNEIYGSLACLLADKCTTELESSSDDVSVLMKKMVGGQSELLIPKNPEVCRYLTSLNK